MNAGRAGRSPLEGERGLTLLEVVVALAILGAGIVGVLRAFSTSMMASKAAEMHSYAATLTGQVASELERRADLESGRLSGRFAEAGPNYTWEADVEPVSSEGLLRAEITVLWAEGSRRRHLTMITCLRPPTRNDAETAPPASPSEGGG